MITSPIKANVTHATTTPLSTTITQKHEIEAFTSHKFIKNVIVYLQNDFDDMICETCDGEAFDESLINDRRLGRQKNGLRPTMKASRQMKSNHPFITSWLGGSDFAKRDAFQK